jgi:hypothetical protein
MTATASGLMIPAPPRVSPDADVSAQTATATLTIANFCKNVTNTGSSGTIVLTLPAVAAVPGLAMRVQLTVAQIVQLLPATGEKIFLGGSGVASKYLNIAAVIGNYVDIFCNGEAYLVMNYSGVVTKEA